MKKILMGLLLVGSFSSFANCLESKTSYIFDGEHTNYPSEIIIHGDSKEDTFKPTFISLGLYIKYPADNGIYVAPAPSIGFVESVNCDCGRMNIKSYSLVSNENELKHSPHQAVGYETKSGSIQGYYMHGSVEINISEVINTNELCDENQDSFIKIKKASFALDNYLGNEVESKYLIIKKN